MYYNQPTKSVLFNLKIIKLMKPVYVFVMIIQVVSFYGLFKVILPDNGLTPPISTQTQNVMLVVGVVLSFLSSFYAYKKEMQMENDPYIKWRPKTNGVIFWIFLAWAFVVLLTWLSLVFYDTLKMKL